MKYNKTLQIFATPSDESQSNLAVTAVAEYVFCSRKAALVAHHVPGDESSPNFALGTTEHELRKKLAERLRDRYRDLTSVQSVDQFLHQDLLDVIIAASTWVKNTARMTHPLYFDQIEMTLRNHTEEILLREEEGRLVRYRQLIASGMDAAEATNVVLPVELERTLYSSLLRLKGKVDQVWLRDGRRIPVDLKTHNPHLRTIFEESHWIQVALYGLLLEEAGGQVQEVGLHYTHRANPEFRPLDDDLRSRALKALREAREAMGRGIPPVPSHEDKCAVCLHRSKCFGASRVDESPSQVGLMSVPLPIPTVQEEPVEMAMFRDWHVHLSRFFRQRGRPSRKDIDRWVKERRHAGLAGCGAIEKIATRRMVKMLEKLLWTRLHGAIAFTHETYFGGSRIETAPGVSGFFVVRGDSVVPWAYVGAGLDSKLEEIMAHSCFIAMGEAELPCNGATLVDREGSVSNFPFGEQARMRWASTLVDRVEPSRQAQAPVARPIQPQPIDGSDASSSKAEHANQSRAEYVGFIWEDRTRPLRLALRGDRVCGFLKEEHRGALAKEDLVIAEHPSAKDGKRILLRVLEITSAPRSAGTTTKSVSELESQLLLEPLAEQCGDGEPVAPVANDDLSKFELRLARAEEVRDFLQLPGSGLPLGHLVASGEPVVVNFPFTGVEDNPFRSFFVVGAKGKGKTSFVREFVSLTTSFRGVPNESRPAVIVLDGEPNREGDSSEFCKAALRRSHQDLAKQLGGSLLDEPEIQEVRIERARSGLAFSYGEIKLEDVVLLLPSLAETTGNVLRVILKQMEDEGGAMRNLSQALDYLRRELRENGQIDGRTARAIAQRLMSPQVEILEQSAPDAVTVRELLKPGTITVLNVVDLADDQRKVIALYLLLAFEKLAEEKGGVNALLVMDEAEKLFPRARGGHVAPTTIQRVAHRVAGITKRGRRRRFGIVVCTQTPSDVDRDIVSNCDTKLVFNVSGNDSWLRENLGADLVPSVKTLPTGQCYVDLRKVSGVLRPTKTRLFRA